MLDSTKIIIIVYLYVLVQCEIPDLNVRRMDRSLIARKRQDTLDMCRIFTEENAKMEHTKPKIIKSYNTIPKSQTNRRPKREVEMKYAVNPTLKEEDVKRVEKIVEKLYDEMEERGENVAYKKNTLPTTTPTTTTSKKPTSMSSANPKRRFLFAPELLVTVPPFILSEQSNDTLMYDKARWNHGIIPYFIDSKTYDAQLQDFIIKAFDYIEKATCIRLQKLRERPMDRKSLSEVDWLYITNPTGIRQCVHSNERRKIDGVQLSVLGYDCMSLGDIVHEVMHILGFSHEHTRSDRDQYISIFWDNVKPGYKKYFEITKPGDQYTLENLPYDYASVLHYPPRAFSKNGQLTIWTQSGIKIGQREGLSEIDVEKVGTIYSGECVERNREYLLKTCPSVVKSGRHQINVTQQQIEDYFRQRLWPYGMIHYKLRDKMEFSTEEKENIKAVIRHIETETCIKFKDISADEETDSEDGHEDDHDLHDNKPLDSYESVLGAEFEPLEFSAPINEDRNNELALEHYTTPPINSELNLPETILAHPKDPERSREPGSKRISINEIVAKGQKTENKKETQINNAKSQVKKIGRRKNRRRMIKRPAKMTAGKAGRRHADNIMMLSRSAEPGCKCPKPGKPGGNAVLVINADCFNSVNELLHLFVHVLGLDHQHNMHDRDEYLHIVWDNLTSDVRKELINTLPPAASVGFDYDYQSVMHYPWLQIKNGVTNIMYPIWNDGWAIGNWQGLSSVDVQKINLLYFSNCAERQVNERNK